MGKPGDENRAMFISPYLRRPIRPLKKVLSERDEDTVAIGRMRAANDGTVEAVTFDSASWRSGRKRALMPD